jgi:hypothetical protein
LEFPFFFGEDEAKSSAATTTTTTTTVFFPLSQNSKAHKSTRFQKTTRKATNLLSVAFTR